MATKGKDIFNGHFTVLLLVLGGKYVFNSINDGVNIDIHSPVPISRKGRPPFKRLKSGVHSSPYMTWPLSHQQP